MNYSTFRKQFFDNLNEDVRREIHNQLDCELDIELELICQEEYAQMFDRKSPKYYIDC
jgi:hypothetical protein